MKKRTKACMIVALSLGVIASTFTAISYFRAKRLVDAVVPAEYECTKSCFRILMDEELKPRWTFRYENKRTGKIHARMFVAPWGQPYCYDITLDPPALFGRLP